MLPSLPVPTVSLSSWAFADLGVQSSIATSSSAEPCSELSMHSGFTGEEVREATVVPAIPSKYTEVVEVQTLAGTKVGTTRLPLNASVRTLRDEIQRWQRPKEGAYEDPEMELGCNRQEEHGETVRNHGL
eukprot:s80_g23.t2